MYDRIQSCHKLTRLRHSSFFCFSCMMCFTIPVVYNKIFRLNYSLYGFVPANAPFHYFFISKFYPSPYIYPQRTQRLPFQKIIWIKEIIKEIIFWWRYRIKPTMELLRHSFLIWLTFLSIFARQQISYFP